MTVAVNAGFDLAKLDNMMKKLDASLDKFVNKSIDAQRKVSDAFSKMGQQGMQQFLSNLSSAINKVIEIGNKGDSIKWSTDKLDKYIDHINTLVKLVQQAQGAGYILPTKNLNTEFQAISKLKEELKSINNELNNGKETGTDSNGKPIYRQLTKDEQNAKVEQKKNIQEQLKYQNQAIQERLNNVRKALQAEVKETKKAEEQKRSARQQSYKGSIKYSDNAKTIEQERQAIVNLEAARDKLKKTDSDYAKKLEELNKRINAHRISIEDATKTDAQRNALTSSTRAEYARLLAEQEKLRQSYEKLKTAQKTTGATPESQKALRDIVQRYRDVYSEISRYKQSANGKLDATERKFLADQAAMFAENEKRKTEILRQENEKRNKENQKYRTISSATAEKVISTHSSAKSTNQQLLAIQKLKEARDNLDKTDKKYEATVKRLNNEIAKHQREIDKTKGKTDELSNKKRGLMDISGQLQRRLALVFSVSQISGYINQIIKVRGEFEMYHRSLQVLLQDKDEANELWDKTVALAVKSPFTVSDLIRNTKQLAAYRVESEKLYETNKMLSDVSAGLGVDMNRLILAFGQVKAANFLRGTELRQFSEAGVNMLGELAKYFTELEGRAVSVGDVFERVSKRMVSFADVEEIFKRITGEGGVFYQMQEKQAATLKGIQMNFRDSIDLMLNDIGKMNEGTLKGFFEILRRIINNWRYFVPYIKAAGVAFATYFGINTLKKIALGFKAIFAVVSAHPFIKIGALIATAMALTQKWFKAQNKVNAALEEVEKNVTESLEESIALYRKLTETINDATKSGEERNKAYDDLKSKFSEILPDQYLELKYIEALNGSYKDAETAMLNYYNAKAKAQKVDKINQIYESDIIDETSDIIKKITDNINSEEFGFNEVEKVKLRAGVSGVVNSVVEDAKKGLIALDEIQDEIAKRLAKYADITENRFIRSIYSTIGNKTTRTGSKNVIEGYEDLEELIKKRNSALNQLTEGLPTETYDERVAANLINAEAKKIETAMNYFSEVANLYDKVAKGLYGRNWEISTEYEDDFNNIVDRLGNNKALEKYIPALSDVFDKLREAAGKGAFEYSRSLQNIESELTESLSNIVIGSIENEELNSAGKQLIENFYESLRDKAKELKPNAFQESVEKAFELAASKANINKDIFARFIPDSEKSLSQTRQEIEAYLSSIQSQIKEYENSIAAGGDKLTPDIVDNTKKQIDELKKQVPAMQHAIRLLGGDPEKDKSKKESIFDERLRVIKELHKAYKELRKTENEAASVEGAYEKYKQAFIDAYKGTNLLPQGAEQMSGEEFAKFVGFPTEDGMIKFFDDLKKLAKDKEDEIKVGLAKGEIVWEFRTEGQTESLDELKAKFDKLFGNYELTLDFHKENIPEDLAKDLFNVDYTTLDDLKDAVEESKSSFFELGKNGENVYNELIKKISNLEGEELKKRANEYVKFLKKGMNDRVRIKIQEIEELRRLDESKDFKDEPKKMIREGIEEKTKSELDKNTWEEFKKSDLYSYMFEDLEFVGTKTVNALLEKLELLKSSLTHLPIDQYKEIVSEIEKLENMAMDRKPLTSLFGSTKELEEAMNEFKKFSDDVSRKNAEKMFLEASADSAIYQEELDDIETLINAKEKGLKLTEEEAEAHGISVDLLSKGVDELYDQKNLLEGLRDGENEVAKAAKKLIDSYKNQNTALSKAHNNITKWGEAFTQVLDGVDALLDAFGVAEDDTARLWIENIKNVVNMIMQVSFLTVAFHAMGIAANNALGIIGVIASALMAIAQLFASLFQMHDNRLEKQIEEWGRAVERLERQYAKLEESIGRAYRAANVATNVESANANIESQIRLYNSMIAAERDKKKTDYDRIQEWNDAIEDLRKEQRETVEETIEGFGGTYDFRGSAREFVDAWVSAFQETGSGLSGLQESFNDFFANVVSEQAVMRGAAEILKPYYDAINNALAGDYEISDQEMNAIADIQEQQLEKLDNFMDAWYDKYGDYYEMGDMSGLQKGIEGVSESTAQIIEALLNSMRFYVADSNSQLKALVAAQLGEGDANTPNPMLAQLQVIAKQTTAIHDLIDSVVGSGHPKGRSGIRVFVD